MSDFFKTLGKELARTFVKSAIKAVVPTNELDAVEERNWYCDNCDALLNEQPGFTYDCGVWTCTECGHENLIDESEIVDEAPPRGYCRNCEHSSEFPDCKNKCPYEFY